MHRSVERLIGTIFVSLLALTAAAHAQIEIRGVIGSGATAAVSGTTAIVGTIGQSLIGPTTGGGTIDAQGFWFIAVPAVSVGGVESDAAAAGANLRASRNPFGSSTELHVTLNTTGAMSLKLYDALGREIRTLLDGVQEAGPHSVILDASGLESGSYLAQLVAGQTRTTLRLMVVK